MDAIKCQGLCKSYASFALRDVSFTLPGGAVCGLVGENGAGKSTLIRLLLGAQRADGGSAQVLGHDAQSHGFYPVRQDIGVVPDEGCFPEGLNLREVERILRATYRRWDTERFLSLTERFALPERTPFRDYSRGMKMKLSIAAALSHNARLLVLDEATSGLDPIVREEIVELFRDFVHDDEHSVLMSSHIVSDLEKVCDYIAFLHRGRLALWEEKDALLERYGLFTGTAEQAGALRPEAVAARSDLPYGGVRLLVRRQEAPPGFQLDKPTVEDVILALVKGAGA